MNKISKKYLIAALCIIIALAIIIIKNYHNQRDPSAIYAKMAKDAGVVKKNISVDGYNISYYERINRCERTLILLHGISGNKNDFLKMASYIPQNINIILPDLAGHGENEKLPTIDYGISAQAKLINKFLSQKGIDSIIIGGNSMGGHIALSFALRFPEKTKKLILINSAGISVKGNHAYSGYNKKIESKAEMIEALKYGYYSPPISTDREIEMMISDFNRNREFIFNSVIPAIKNDTDYDLLPKINELKMPVLILWGRYDRVITLDVARVFKEKLQNSYLVTINNSAHCPQNESPEEISIQILSFINDDYK